MGEAGPPVARGRPSSGGHRKRQSTARRRGGPARSSEEGPVMGLEPREPGRSGRLEANPQGKEPTGGPKLKVKSFEIPQRLVYEACEANNLYKLWNRMSAGAYLPLPVRAVDIPKDHGEGVRRLGVPCVVDRI